MVNTRTFLISTANKNDFVEQINSIHEIYNKEANITENLLPDFTIDYKPVVMTDETQYIVYTALVTVRTFK